MANNPSKTTFLIGGSGKVARHITRLLSSPPHNHTVYSLIRKESQVQELQSIGATPIVQNVEEMSAADLASTIKKCNPGVIVWSAGAGGVGGPERTKAVDRDAAIKAMEAASQAGIKRFITVSATDVRDRENKPIPSWYSAEDKERSDTMWQKLGTYMEMKLAADKELVTGNDRRGLIWTIVKPGLLKEDEGTGKVRVGEGSIAGGIPREDVAKVVIACVVDGGKTGGCAFNVLAGDQTVEDAVEKVAKEKINNFEGYY